MKYKEYLGKYIGEKMHFDIDPNGDYSLDMTCRTYANGFIKEVHDEFVIIYDQLDKSNLVVSFMRLYIRFLDEEDKK